MKLRILPLLLVGLALPAMAQDRSFALFYDKAPGKDGTLTQGSTTSHLKSDDFSGLGLRFGVNVAKWGPATLEFNASYRFSSKADVALEGMAPGQTLEYKWGYVSAGADVNFTKVVDFGAGLDLRAQTDSFEISMPGLSEKFGVNRFSPWIRAHVGYTFDTGSLRPFVALEGAWDLGNDSSYDIPVGATSIDLSKAYGVGLPKTEYSLQVGLRF